MKKTILLFFTVLFALSFLNTSAQQYYWVAFTDKNNTPYSISNPQEFLSQRAIDRRIMQGIAIDSLDLPVDPNYINEVIQSGVSLKHRSKWLNGITVKVEIDSFEYKMLSLPFIKEVQLTKPEMLTKSAINKFSVPIATDDFLYVDTSLYGASISQLSISNGQFLHNQDYKGQGIQVAVIDAGFYQADIYEAFDSLWINNQILGIKDFVDATEDFYSTNYHGMSVLSCMGGNIPGELIGTAPKADYWLIRSEDSGSEYVIEEDNWVAAAEFADSVGVDVINSSLGYFLFDDASMNHTYAEMDGKTTRVTRGANIAASRGMLVFTSAGNEGKDSWKYIIAPSDGDKVIGVGAVSKDSIPAPFTSYGPASTGDVKPNVSTVGWNTVLECNNGSVGFSNGTSFSSPVMAGLGACLWQANPDVTADQVKSAIEQSANLFSSPDSLLGFGIPDFKLADQFLKSLYVEKLDKQSLWHVFPNPVRDVLSLQYKGSNYSGNLELTFYTVDGRLLRKKMVTGTHQIILNDIRSLPSGLLILKIKSDDFAESVKLIKSR
jgi:subtilisin family serine protease